MAIKNIILNIICLALIAACSVLYFKAATDEPLYAVIQVDDNGNEWITDQYLTLSDCWATPHYECRPMEEIE